MGFFPFNFTIHLNILLNKSKNTFFKDFSVKLFSKNFKSTFELLKSNKISEFIFVFLYEISLLFLFNENSLFKN